MQLTQPFFARFGQRTLDFLIMQWCIMLISWPIMLSWGLPVATLSPLGNFAFGPFLSAFLILSTLITVGTWCALPIWPCTMALEYITQAWFVLMKLTPWDWQVTMPRPPLMLMLLAPAGTIAIMHFIPFRSRPWRCLIALVLLSAVLFGLYASLPRETETRVPWGMRSSVVVNRSSSGRLTAYDDGFVRRKSGITSWVMWTLLPSLATIFGTQEIDVYEFGRLTPATVAYATFLCERHIIKTLIVPCPANRQSADLIEELVPYAVRNEVKMFLREKPVTAATLPEARRRQ